MTRPAKVHCFFEQSGRNFIADFILGEPIGNHPQQQELPL